MHKIRVGIIGIGDISRVYINNLRKYDAVEIVACASRGLEKAQKKAAEFQIPKAYASGMEVIQDTEVDLILNLTTPAAHFEYNLAALQAGKHVYSEKPLAMTFAEGQTADRNRTAKRIISRLCTGYLLRQSAANLP